ncbi:hypothetical protein, partial [Brevibacillus agri]|uniref:hypothetical protein n=1 Tax=Brevibacillus agri TaxID=51101 RepID=UPI003D258952
TGMAPRIVFFEGWLLMNFQPHTGPLVPSKISSFPITESRDPFSNAVCQGREAFILTLTDEFQHPHFFLLSKSLLSCLTASEGVQGTCSLRLPQWGTEGGSPRTDFHEK